MLNRRNKQSSVSLIQTLGSLVASGSALAVLADFGFCTDVEDFDQVYASSIVENRSHRKLSTEFNIG